MTPIARVGPVRPECLLRITLSALNLAGTAGIAGPRVAPLPRVRPRVLDRAGTLFRLGTRSADKRIRQKQCAK